MSRTFVSVDVETANSARWSICQIGLAAFVDGRLAWEWGSLVNPECDFDQGNIGVHGIRSDQVTGAPKWPSVLAAIGPSLSRQIVVSHSRFDCDALYLASARYGVSMPECRWLDSCVIARESWPDFPNHKLNTLAQSLAIPLTHHDAASDAKACGHVIERAVADTGRDLASWIEICGTVSPPSGTPNLQAKRPRYSEAISRDGNPNGPLADQVWLCTGETELPRTVLAEMAAEIGFTVRNSISRKVTMLVVGSRDPDAWNGDPRSTKLKAVEDAIARGQKVHILTEKEFLAVVNYYRSRGR